MYQTQNNMCPHFGLTDVHYLSFFIYFFSLSLSFVRKNLKGRNHSEDSHRWEDNIRIDLREIGLRGVD
jgi:hypothetical protein